MNEPAIYISLVSILVAAVSLGWNIYRDVIVKPKIKVTITRGSIYHPPYPEGRQRVCVSATNFGPGKTRACMLRLKQSSWWRKIFRRETDATLMPDYEDPLSEKLPKDLDIGDKVCLSFRLLPNLFIKGNSTHIGIADPFGRIHWCSRKNYKHAKELHLKRDAQQDNEQSG
jgi:hypothetical protein